MIQDPNEQQPRRPDDPLDIKPEPGPRPPPLPPRLDYGRTGPYFKPPPPRTTPLGFSARAAGGFVLFFATIIVGGYIANLFVSTIAFFSVIATAFAALVVVSFIFHRRGWLTGWLTGFILAAAVVGLVIYTCRFAWH
jgi:hypothetical protein